MTARTVTAALLLLLQTGSIHAEDGLPLAGARQQLETLAAGTQEACLDGLGKVRVVYKDVRTRSVPSFPGFDLVSEAIRLSCEALRLKNEAGRLELESVRLLSEASRLDKRWEDDSRAKPSLLNQYMERDKSQKLMRQDAETAREVSRTLLRVSGMLHAEASRILGLAHDNARLLAAADVQRIKTALDAESQNDILSRLLGLPAAPDNKKL